MVDATIDGFGEFLCVEKGASEPTNKLKKKNYWWILLREKDKAFYPNP